VLFICFSLSPSIYDLHPLSHFHFGGRERSRWNDQKNGFFLIGGGGLRCAPSFAPIFCPSGGRTDTLKFFRGYLQPPQ
jgi:hypothetical protein